MAKWLILSGGYLWLGFTIGYFFRKWMETSYLPRFAAERDTAAADRDAHLIERAADLAERGSELPQREAKPADKDGEGP